MSGKLYVGLREQGKKALKNMPPVWALARRAEEHVKGMVVPGTLFEELGFNYIGPVDGHDLPTLVKTLRNLRGLKGPQFLHVVTKKGKGYKPAEDNPCGYHGVGAFDPLTGTLNAGKSGTPSYTDVFGDWVCDMAAQDPRLVAITPAMRAGSGLDPPAGPGCASPLRPPLPFFSPPRSCRRSPNSFFFPPPFFTVRRKLLP